MSPYQSSSSQTGGRLLLGLSPANGVRSCLQPWCAVLGVPPPLVAAACGAARCLPKSSALPTEALDASPNAEFLLTRGKALESYLGGALGDPRLSALPAVRELLRAAELHRPACSLLPASPSHQAALQRAANCRLLIRRTSRHQLPLPPPAASCTSCSVRRSKCGASPRTVMAP